MAAAIRIPTESGEDVLRIYLATWLNDPTMGPSLTKKGARYRLLSFFFLKELKITSQEVKEYLRTGICDIRKDARLKRKGE